jgi:hypothetical protein
MADLIELPFKGGTLLVAAAGTTGAQAFTGSNTIVKATQTFEEVLDTARSLGDTMAEKLKGLNFANAEASFGVKFTGKGGFIIAEASAEASFTIKFVFKGS